MELTKKLKERFCKDCNLSINVFDKPYFIDRVRLIGGDEAIDKLCEFKLMLRDFEDESAYFKYYDSIKDTVIKHLHDGIEKSNFNDMPLPERIFSSIGKHELYTPDNDGKMFLSLDLSKANFTMFANLFSDVVDNCKTYEEFIQQFTDYDYIASSKYIRQVVFGNCNPKRQIAFETFMIEKIARNVFNDVRDKQDELHIDTFDIYSVNSDEIIFEIGFDTLAGGWLNNNNDLMKVVNASIPDYCMAQLFILRHAYNSGHFRYVDGISKQPYIKIDCIDKHETIHCLSVYDAPKFMRAHNHEQENDMDNVFCFEGRLAKFL